MRQKLFTFFLALLSSMSAIYASDTQVDGIWYDFDSSTMTASVTYRGSNYDSYYDEYSGSVIIPETVDYFGTTYSVTSIGDQAFYNCSELTSIIIPNSVTSIGFRAFSDCESLTYVTFGSGIKTIDVSIFDRCSPRTIICMAETPPTLVSTEHSSLWMETVYILSGTKAEYERSNWWRITAEFIEVGCEESIDPTLQQITYTADHKIVKPNTDDFGAYILSDIYDDINGVGTITFTGPITSIGNSAFSGSDLTSITIPNSVTSIGEEAFFSCSFLTSITIPNSVTSIGERAFFNCDIDSITIPNSVTSIGYNAFFGCGGSTSMVVEAGNTKYDSRDNCNAIIETATNTLIFGCQKTVIPNTVTSIGSQAFDECPYLTSITIPNSVASIGSRAFAACSLTSITIPNSVTSIEDEVFIACYSLTSVTIGSGVTSIGKGPFSHCDALTSIKVEAGNTTYDSRGNCNAIIETATNTLIAGCQNTVIPNSVTSIGEEAFFSCSFLTSITIPNSVTSIGERAFYACEFTSITIPNSVTSIGDRAFYWCDALTSVTIGSGVTSIGDDAFYSCSSLTSITCEATTPPTLGSRDVFPSNLETVYIPCGTKEAYEASDWKQYVAEFIEECEAEQYTRDVTPNKYGTICLPFGSTDFSGATFYEIAYKAPFIIYFDEVTKLEAGKPYVFYAHSNKLVVTSDGTRVNNPLFDNGLYGTFDEIIAAATNILTNNYIVNNNSLCMCGEYCSLPANRAYVKLDEVSSTARALAPGRKRVSLSVLEENTSTALDNISEDTENIPAQKGVYDILGRKMLEPTGIGFYIIDGQKVIIAK